MIYNLSKKALFIVAAICFLSACTKEGPTVDEYESIKNSIFRNLNDVSYHVRLTPEVLYLYRDGKVMNAFTYTIKDEAIFTEQPGNENFIVLGIDLDNKELRVLDTNLNSIRSMVFTQVLIYND